MPSPAGTDALNFYLMSTLTKAGARCGFNMQEVVAQAQLQIEVGEMPQAAMSMAAVRRLFDAAEVATQTGYFPLVLGDHYSFDGVPEVDTFIATCTTLRAGMRCLDWLPYLVHPALRIEQNEEGPHHTVSVWMEGEEPAHPGLIEAALMAMVKFARLIQPTPDPLREVWFRHGPRAPLEVYKEAFHAPVRFNQPDNRVVNAVSCLDVPLKGGFPALNAQAQLLVEQRLKKLTAHGPLSSRVEQLLTLRADLLGAGVDEVAAVLDLHPRTLQRRLKDEGGSFADVQTRVRHDRARKLLRETDLDIETISLKLGFVDRHSFSRAFTRWEGVSPAAFRKPSRQPG